MVPQSGFTKIGSYRFSRLSFYPKPVVKNGLFKLYSGKTLLAVEIIKYEVSRFIFSVRTKSTGE